MLSLILFVALSVVPAAGQGLDFVTPALPEAISNTPYTPFRIEQNRLGLACCTWTILSALPPGITVDCTWCEYLILQGTPTTVGRYDIRIQLKDFRETVTKTYTLVVNPKLVVTVASGNTLPPAMVGRPYGKPILQVSGGAPPLRYSLFGPLPAGLSLDPITGILNGTPVEAAADPFLFWVSVEDSIGQGTVAAVGSCPSSSISCRFSLTVGPELRIEGPAVIAGAVGASLVKGKDLRVSGGTYPMTPALIAGTLPVGVTLPGLLNGTAVPSQSGDFAVQFKVTDNFGYQAMKSILLRIAPSELKIDVVPTWQLMQNRTFSRQLTATGGFPPYTFRAAQLPPGLSLQTATGIVTGTPLDLCPTGCTPASTVTAIDSNGLESSYNPVIKVHPELVITTETLGITTINLPYSRRLQFRGGALSAVIGFSVVSGVFPTGLTFNPLNATLAGTPTQTGQFLATFKAVDEAGFAAFKVLTLQVVPPADPPRIDTAFLPPATSGAPYNAQVIVTAGTQPLSFLSGTLPPGLVLHAETGVISGTPQSAGAWPVTIQVMDAQSRSVARNYQLTVMPASAEPRVVTAALPAAVPNFAYSVTLQAADGASPYRWSLAGGVLPPGLSLTEAGVLSGTATAIGTYTFLARVTDFAGRTGSREFTMSVGESSEPCQFTVSPGSYAASPAGDVVRIDVGTRASCSWSAATTLSWITIVSPEERTGSGWTQVQITPNPGSVPRSGAITVAGQAVVIQQPAAACGAVPGVRSLTVPPAGGEQQVAVAVASGCFWIAGSTDKWLSLDSGALGTGPGTLKFQTSAHTARVARVSAVSLGGHLVQLVQKPADPLVFFDDVPPVDPFFDAISVLRDKGIAQPCSGANYCPGDVMTRAEMAAFLIRSLIGETFLHQSTPYFSDVPATHPQFKYIQKLKELGITSGCTASTYCPADAVTRGQMAVFIVRSRLGLTATQTFAFNPVPYFTDVPFSHAQFPYIQKLRELGITSGCTASTYCDGDPTLRGQMAVFVSRGLLAK
ncbi:MAG: putative Ig domain-containing protein [Bryobacterales bacterium]|nr:putative Ig domain-containing protein [Bryobacterales bacterium]